MLAVQAQALAHARFEASAAAAVNHLARILGCERVSLGLFAGARLRVVGISNATDFAQRATIVARLCAAMAEAVDQRVLLVHPLPPGASPAVSLAHQALAQANGHLAILSVPIVLRHEVLGALLFERQGGFDAATLEAAKDAAMFAGPLLALQQRAEGAVSARVASAMRPLRPARPGPYAKATVSPWRLAWLALPATLIALAFWPATDRVVAPARVEGAVQQVIAAPSDGFLGSVAVRPGDSVKAGQVLLTLDARELALERDKWAAEVAQLDKQYREAMSRDEAAPIVVARAKLEQAQSQYELAASRLERATLRAPMDGVVISGDLTQSLGAPLQRGQELMTLAPDRGWRIVAEVEEQRIGALREGQNAQALFAAVTGEPVGFAVARIAPVATQAEGHNVFEVEGAPARGSAALRPGMRGVVRIEVGDSTLGAIAWQRAVEAWRRFSWRWGG